MAVKCMYPSCDDNATDELLVPVAVEVCPECSQDVPTHRRLLLCPLHLLAFDVATADERELVLAEVG